MDKKKELDKIADEIEKCKICKVGKSGKAVPGEGNPDADVMFIGEAPGRQEAATGRPFVGRSGQFLRSQVRKIGLSEEDVYITSPVKYLPDRGTPSLSDIAHGRIHLQKQLEIIRPKIIVFLGNVASRGVLNDKIAVGKMHGQTLKKEGLTYFFTFHPSAGLRFPPIKKLIEEDFKSLKNLIDSD